MDAIKFLQSLKTELPKMATFIDGSPVDEFYESVERAIAEIEMLEIQRRAAISALEAAQYVGGSWIIPSGIIEDFLGI